MSENHLPIPQQRAKRWPWRPRPPGVPHHDGVGVRHVFFVTLPVAAVIAGAASMWHFVSFAVMSNPVLNGLIITVLSWGILTMLGHLRTLFGEERVFRAGMAWLQDGDASGEQNPRYGPPAFVTGMLERLSKLGLGQQVHIHSSAMEPEIEALEQYLEKRQELSQFLIGLMVGLGLLGTFVGLLETLVETSSLIGTIASGVGGSSGGDMEAEFAKIVGGLQRPLAAMGTAFSASMFGLVGSIVLGFQMVAVRKASTDLVECVRSEVLSLAKKSRVNDEVEISERFLAVLLADILEQHRLSCTSMAGIVDRLEKMMPQVAEVASNSAMLCERLMTQEEALDRAASTIGSMGQVVPTMVRIATSSEAVLQAQHDANSRIARMLSAMPEQQRLHDNVHAALGRLSDLERALRLLAESSDRQRSEMRQLAVIVKRMDGTLWNTEKDALYSAVGANAKGGR